MRDKKIHEILRVKDPYYNKVIFNQFVGSIIKNGKKNKVYTIFYFLCNLIKLYFKKSPILFLLVFLIRCSFSFRLKKQKIKKKFYDIPMPIDNLYVILNNAFKLLFVVVYYKRKKEKQPLSYKVFRELYFSLYKKRNSILLQSLYMMIKDIKYNKNYKSYKWRRKKY